MSGLGFRLTEPLPIPYEAGTLTTVLSSLLTEQSEKVKERTQVGTWAYLPQKPYKSRLSVLRWIVYKYESSWNLL